MRMIFNEALLNELNRLSNENIALKKQVDDIKTCSVAKEVAGHIDDWLSTPYKGKKSESQDINDFALKITKYIDYRMRD